MYDWERPTGGKDGRVSAYVAMSAYIPLAEHSDETFIYANI